MNFRISFSFLVILCTPAFQAQDVEQVYGQTKKALRENPLDVKGSIGAAATFYDAKGIADRRDPFYWVINANLNFRLFEKIDAPFTAVFTERQNQFSHGLDRYTQPFNQFGISPTYRWLTVHAGYRTLEFSEYSLSGAMFLGGGVEIKPKQNWQCSSFYGRFMKAIPHGGVDGIAVAVPSYRRLGGGTELRIGTNDHFIDFIYLRIKDDPNSIPYDTALTITPEENQIMALSAKQPLGKNLQVNGDFAYSMFSKNLYEDPYVLQSFTFINQVYTPRPSSNFNKAFNLGLDYTANASSVGLKYKRVDPDYRTLGAVFLTNDVEEISVNGNHSFTGNKISLNAAVGLQHNNLDQIQSLTSRRVISSFCVNYNPGERFNLNGTYSNFSSNTLPVRDVFTDTIRFVQLTQNGGLAQTISFGNKNNRQVLMNMVTYQESKATSQELTTVFSENFSHQLQVSKIDLTISTSLVFNKTENKLYGTNTGVGPQLRVQKNLLHKRISLSLSGGLQEMQTNSAKEGRVISLTTGLQVKLTAQQNLRLDGIYTERVALSNSGYAFSETRGSFSYTYSFGLKKNPKPAL